MRKLIIIIYLLVCSIACKSQQENMRYNALLIVIKLISAEEDLAFEEAKKYIDITQVYSKFAPGISPDSLEMTWKQLKTISYDMKNDPKFQSRGMRYYDYEIGQIKTLLGYQVIFTDNQGVNPYQKIVYELQFVDKELKVVDIKHIKIK